MRQTKRSYDTPILAMIKAFNDHAGGEVSMIDLRDGWYFHLAHKEDNRFGYWLDKTLEIVKDDVKIVYNRNPGWYTEVRFFVEREIQV